MANYNYRRNEWPDQNQSQQVTTHREEILPLFGSGTMTSRQQAAGQVLQRPNIPRRFPRQRRIIITPHPVHPRLRFNLHPNQWQQSANQLQFLLLHLKRTAGIALPIGHSGKIHKTRIHQTIQFLLLFRGSLCLCSLKAYQCKLDDPLATPRSTIEKAAGLRKQVRQVTKMLTILNWLSPLLSKAPVTLWAASQLRWTGFWAI